MKPLVRRRGRVLEPDTFVESQGGAASTANEGAQTRLKDAQEALRRLQAAIVAGIDPAAVREAINAAQAQKEAARMAFAAAPPSSRLDVAEVYAMVDTLGDVGEAIKEARPDSLHKLYKELGIKVSYRHEESGGEAVISLVVANVRVRGGTRAPKRGTPAPGRCSCG